MVGGLRLLVYADGAYPLFEIGRHENEIAVLLRLVRHFLLVDLEGRRVRLSRMRCLPRIDKGRGAVHERLEHARMQWILGFEIEVAGDQRRGWPGHGVKWATRRV